MRKLLSFALLILLSVPCFAYDHPTTSGLIEQSNGPASDPVRVYMLVRNPNQTAAASTTINVMNSRDAVVWDCVSDDGVTVNYPSKVGISGSSDALAGILVTAIPSQDVAGSAGQTIGRANWGYMQTFGPVFGSVDTNGITVGQGFRASSLDGNVVAGGGVATGAGGGSFGFAYDTDANGVEVKLFIRTR